MGACLIVLFVVFGIANVARAYSSDAKSKMNEEKGYALQPETTANKIKRFDSSYTPSFENSSIKIQDVNKLLSNDTITNYGLTTSDVNLNSVGSPNINYIRTETTEQSRTESNYKNKEKRESPEKNFFQEKYQDFITPDFRLDIQSQVKGSTEYYDGNTEINDSTEAVAGSTEIKDISISTPFGSTETNDISTEYQDINITNEGVHPKQNSENRNRVKNILGIIALINIMLIAVLLIFLLVVAINRIRKNGFTFRFLPVRKQYALVPLQDRCDMDQGLFTMDHEV